MDSYDARQAHINAYWWITSLAISVICCSVLFVWFSSYIYQIKEEMAITQVRFDIAQSRMNELSTELQILNHRATVQQIQIVPNGTASTPETAAPATPTSPAPPPAQPVMPAPVPEKH